MSKNNEIGDITDTGSDFQNIISDETLDIFVYPVIVIKAFR